MIIVKLSENRVLGVDWMYPKVLTGHRVTKCRLFDLYTVPVRREVFIAEGKTTCSPLDNFEKEKGRKVSLARAMEIAKFSKTTREMIWVAYLNRFPEETLEEKK